MPTSIIKIEYQIYGLIFFVSAWNIFYNREELLKLLNDFLSLGKIYNQVFGKPLKVARVNFLLQFVHGLWLWNSFALPQNWFVYPICYQNNRIMLQVYLADIAMMFPFQLLKPLIHNLRLFSPAKNENRVHRVFCAGNQSA